MSAPSWPPTDAADLAERALIGALLWDSGRVRDVRDWLRPDDLNHWRARAVYETLIGLDREGRSLSITELYAVISAGTYHSGRPGAITAVDLHTYLRDTPATPAASAEFPARLTRSNHVVYARRVVEAAARRMVAEAGSRIQQATEHARDHPDLGAGGIADALAVAQQRLAHLEKRLRHALGSPGAVVTAALSGPVPDTPAEELERWPGPPAPPLTTRAVIEAEREVLATCLTDPTLRAELLSWLTPDDFSRPDHAATWAAFNALTQAATPIDYVTLAWECERHHPYYGIRGLPAAQLVTMAAHSLPGPAVHTVALASLLRHTDGARHQVQAISEDCAADALTVVSAATDAYREVGEHAQRLTRTSAVSRASAALNPASTPPAPLQPRLPTPPPHDPSYQQRQRHHR